MTSSALTLALFSLSAAPALAAGGNCPSAPQNYDTAACNNRCIRDGAGTMICDITAQPGNNVVVVVVKDYRPFVMIGSSRYSAWGTANGANFCCALDSSTASPINGVRVLTGSGVDEVWFTAVHADGSEKNLSSNPCQTASPWFVGFVYPGDGNDRVYGSHSTASDYMDHLTGENGCDQIYGHKGNDFINVDEMRNAGFHSIDNNGESVYGNQGRDEIVGAANDANATDTIFADGGNGADILCTGRVGDVTGNKVFFFGGNEDDEIYSNSSFVAGFDGPIDGGSGDDGCDNPGGGSETNCNRAFDWTNFTPWPPTCK